MVSTCPCTKCPSSPCPKLRAGSKLTFVPSSMLLRFVDLRVSVIRLKWAFFLSIFVIVRQTPFIAIELPISLFSKMLSDSTMSSVSFLDSLIFMILPFDLIIPVNIEKCLIRFGFRV